MIYKGFIKTGTSDKEEFEFYVPDYATEEDIRSEAVAAFWESGLVDLWWEEA